MIINIHDKDLNIIGVLDNSVQNAVHFDDDKLTEDLTTGTSVYEFTAFKNDSIRYKTTTVNPFDSLVVGNWVSFKHSEKEYLLKIVDTERKSNEVYVYAEDLILELRNENVDKFSTEDEKTIEEYIKDMRLINYTGISVRVNEAGTLKKALSFSNTETKLARLLALFKEFNVEHEFTLKLKPNGKIRDFYVDIYLPRNNATGDGGVGDFKSDTILREGKEIKTIAEKQNILEIWNRTRPIGKNTITRVEVKGAKTATVAKEAVVVSSNMINSNGTLSIENIQKILKYSYEYRLLPSGVISQLYLESFWGNSNVARVDNNWSGMTWTGNPNRPSGVVVSQGSPRPSNEGGYYMHFASMDDFFKDYFYLLAKQGIYNVANKNNISDYTKGLFRIGGAAYDYAAAGYDHYNNLMTGIRNGINKNNSNVLDTYDSQWLDPKIVTSTTIEIAAAGKTKAALDELGTLVGKSVGNGQCYAVPAWFSYKLGGAGLGCGLGGFSGLIGSGIRAADIGTDYSWSNFGWGLKVSDFNSGDIFAGAIVNIRGNYGAPWWTGYYGHTVVVESTNGDTMTVIQQNYAGKQYLTRDNYSISQVLPSIQSIVYTPELTNGGRVDGGNKVIKEDVTERYVNVELPTEVKTTEETLDIYISQDTFKEYFDDNGVLEFRVKDGFLDAVQSVEAYPSQFTSQDGGDQWIRRDFEYKVSSEEELIEKALADIKENCYPKIDFEVDGYFDGKIGDTFLIESPKFKPQLNIKARIISKETSFTRPDKSKTKFANYIKLESQVADILQQRLEAILEAKTPYEIRVTASNGIAFKNNEGSSVLSVQLLKSGIEREAKFIFKNGDSIIGYGEKLEVKATDFNEILHVTIEAYVDNKLVATSNITFTDVEDGKDGDQGPKGDDGKTPYLHIAYANSADGRTDFSTSNSENKRYLGTYTDYTQADSTDPTKYKWVDMVGTVKIGGVNLFKGSRDFSGSWVNGDSGVYAEDYQGVKIFKKQALWGGLSQYFEVKVGEEYVFSAYVKSSAKTDNVTFFLAHPSKEPQAQGYLSFGSANDQNAIGFDLTDEYQRIVIKIKITKDGWIMPRLERANTDAYLFFGGYKLERGNIATDYSQSPEDVQEQINNKADQGFTTQQLNELRERQQLQQKELETKALKDDLEKWYKEYLDYVKLDTGDKQRSEQELLALSERIVGINNDLGKTKERWSFLDNYMEAGNEGLVVGKKNGTANIKISDDRISMFSNGSEVMWITQNMLHIDNGVFTKTLQIGKYRFEEYGDNSEFLVIRYLGGN